MIDSALSWLTQLSLISASISCTVIGLEHKQENIFPNIPAHSEIIIIPQVVGTIPAVTISPVQTKCCHYRASDSSRWWPMLTHAFRTDFYIFGSCFSEAQKKKKKNPSPFSFQQRFACGCKDVEGNFECFKCHALSHIRNSVESRIDYGR